MRAPILFVQMVLFGISCQADERFALLQLKIALDLQSTVKIYDSVLLVIESMGYIRSVTLGSQMATFVDYFPPEKMSWTTSLTNLYTESTEPELFTYRSKYGQRRTDDAYKRKRTSATFPREA